MSTESKDQAYLRYQAENIDKRFEQLVEQDFAFLKTYLEKVHGKSGPEVDFQELRQHVRAIYQNLIEKKV